MREPLNADKVLAEARDFLELADRILTGEDNDSVGDLSVLPMEDLIALVEQLQETTWCSICGDIIDGKENKVVNQNATLKKRVAELEGIAKEALLRLPHSRSDCDHYGGESSLCDNCKLVKKFDALSRKDGE